jgi:hypothetical protein
LSATALLVLAWLLNENSFSGATIIISVVALTSLFDEIVALKKIRLLSEKGDHTKK